MIQLNVLSGKMAGQPWVARRFPVHIGRAGNNDLSLEEDGVWDDHAELKWDDTEGFVLIARPQAVLTVNSQSSSSSRLRNGDLIQMGSVRMQFWISATRQRGLCLREFLVWSLIAIVTIVEVFAAYYLL